MGAKDGRIKMGMYKFLMSCGHEAKREVADPAKYYELDKRYYNKQGLCDECWKSLHEQVKKGWEEQNERLLHRISK